MGQRKSFLAAALVAVYVLLIWEFSQDEAKPSGLKVTSMARMAPKGEFSGARRG